MSNFRCCPRYHLAERDGVSGGMTTTTATTSCHRRMKTCQQMPPLPAAAGACRNSRQVSRAELSSWGSMQYVCMLEMPYVVPIKYAMHPKMPSPRLECTRACIVTSVTSRICLILQVCTPFPLYFIACRKRRRVADNVLTRIASEGVCQ